MIQENNIAAFAGCGVTLITNGYNITPVEGKIPRLKKWTTRTIDAVEHSRLAANGAAHDGVGIVTGDVLGVDIDVYDVALADIIEGFARKHFGDAPMRVGQAPKRLLLYRSATGRPAKRKTADYADSRYEKPHKVEVLGNGQQFVAFGIHPKTGRPYQWISGGDPLSISAEDLTAITNEQVAAFLAECEVLLTLFFGKSGTGSHTDDGDGSQHAAGPKKGITLDQVREAMVKINADDRDKWLKVGMAIKHQFSDAGRALWDEWSKTSAKFNQHDQDKAWRNFRNDKPGRVTILSVFEMASVSPPPVPEDASHLFRSVGAGGDAGAGAGPPVWSVPASISTEEWTTSRHHPDMVVRDYLYADVALLIAPGGSGKTTLLLSEAVHIALGLPLWGRDVTKPGVVVILTAEDSRELLVARLRSICADLELTEYQRAMVRERVRISDVSGTGLKLTWVVHNTVTASDKIDGIVEGCRTLNPVLIAIDPAVSFGVGEKLVNDAEQGLVEVGRRLRRDLNCCVRYVHHTGKANAREQTTDQYSGRGGSAFADGARMVAVLHNLGAGEWLKATGTVLHDGDTGMRLSLPKVTYAAPQPDIFIKRHGYRFTAVVAIVDNQTAEQRRQSNCTKVVQFIESEYAANRKHSRRDLETYAEQIGLSRNPLRAAIADLRNDGRVAYHDAGTNRPGSFFYPKGCADFENTVGATGEK